MVPISSSISWDSKSSNVIIVRSWFSGWLFNFSIANIPSWLFVLYLELQFDYLDGGTVVVTLGVENTSGWISPVV
jgi:hypothetical protein